MGPNFEQLAIVKTSTSLMRILLQMLSPDVRIKLGDQVMEWARKEASMVSCNINYTMRGLYFRGGHGHE